MRSVANEDERFSLPKDASKRVTAETVVPMRVATSAWSGLQLDVLQIGVQRENSVFRVVTCLL